LDPKKRIVLAKEVNFENFSAQYETSHGTGGRGKQKKGTAYRN